MADMKKYVFLLLMFPAVLHAEVVARVNGQEITRQEVDAILSVENGGEKPSKNEERAALDRLVNGLLLYQQGIRSGVDKTTETKREIERAKRTIIANQVMNQYLSQARVSKASIELEYEHFSKRNAIEYRVSHILVNDQNAAEELRSQIKVKSDFNNLAMSKSIDKTTAASGGLVGWVQPWKLDPAFADTVVNLPVNSNVSAPVKTRYGWHLVWVDETRSATPPPLEEVRNKITQQLGQKLIADHMKKMREGANIQLLR